MKNYVKEILVKVGHTEKRDNRSYVVRSANTILETGIFDVEVCEPKMAWRGKDGFLYNIRIQFAAKVMRFKTNATHIKADEVLSALSRCIQKEEAMAALRNLSVNEPCGKCEGTGVLPQFMHVHNGVCFDCCGVGRKVSKRNINKTE